MSKRSISHRRCACTPPLGRTASCWATRTAILFSAGTPSGSHCNFDVSVTGREKRGCLRTDVFLNTRALHLFNVHLGTDFFERRQQAKRLIDEAVLRSRSLEGPRVVLGDFNEWTRGHVSQTLAAEFESTDVRTYLGRKRTYRRSFPSCISITYITTLNSTVERVALHRSKTSLIASDHVPLVVDFKLE